MSTRRIQMALLVVTFLLGSVSLATFAQDKAAAEAYSAVARGTGGSVGGKTAQFDFRVTQYTTDDELANFAQLLKRDGCTAAGVGKGRQGAGQRGWVDGQSDRGGAKAAGRGGHDYYDCDGANDAVYGVVQRRTDYGLSVWVFAGEAERKRTGHGANYGGGEN
jgi:hypothetical protein